MKRKIWLLVAVLIGVLSLLFSLVYAQAPHQKLMKIADELGLTDEQINSIRDIQYNSRKTEIELRADLKISRLELRHQMAQDKPDQKEISNLIDKIGETQKKLLKQEVDRKLAMKGILSPEQLEKFIRKRGSGGRRGWKKDQGFPDIVRPELDLARIMMVLGSKAVESVG